MTVEINNVNITRTEVVLDGRGARGVNGALTVTSATGQAVSSRIALAAIASPVNGQLAFLTEAGREGMFVFDASSLTTGVTADPYQAIYVAPAAAPTGASGAWTRRYSGAVNATWYGAIADGTTNNAITLQAWLDHGDRLHLPAGEYYSADDLILRQSAVVEGEGYGFDSRIVDGSANQGYDNMPGSRIRFAAGKGFQVQPQSAQTDEAAAIVVSQEGGFNATIRHLALIGAGTGAAATGLYCRTLVHLEDVHTLFFTGKGFDISAAGGPGADPLAEYGNASLSSLRNCHAHNSGSHGFHVRGYDANVTLLDGCNAISNGGWGFLDESFLGNTYNACHASNNASGSFKCIRSVTDSVYTGCYVEVGTGQAPDLSYRCVVHGNYLAAIAWQFNVGTNGSPTITSSRGVDTNQLIFNQGPSTGQGAITDIKARLYRGSDRGLTLQGSTDGTYSHTLVNAADEVVAQFSQGSKAANLHGPILINGIQVVGAQLAAVTNAAYAGGATPTGVEFNALVDVVNMIAARLRSHGLNA